MGTSEQSPAGVEPVTGSFTATGQSGSFVPEAGRDFNISVWGTFVGTVGVERSMDRGTTWLPKWPDEIFQISEPRSFSDAEPEAAIMYRLNCTDMTSGTINYRVSQ